MRIYYKAISEPYERTLPLTFHCEKGIVDPVYQEFLVYFTQMETESKEAKI
jgi:hypothetical protein